MFEAANLYLLVVERSYNINRFRFKLAYKYKLFLKLTRYLLITLVINGLVIFFYVIITFIFTLHTKLYKPYLLSVTFYCFNFSINSESTFLWLANEIMPASKK